jgi:hypothetical protein
MQSRECKDDMENLTSGGPALNDSVSSLSSSFGILTRQWKMTLKRDVERVQLCHGTVSHRCRNLATYPDAGHCSDGHDAML